MELLLWVWWALSLVIGVIASVLWFLIAGWVSTLLQIGVLVAAIYFVRYGWQRAPAEIWRRTTRFGLFFWSWLRARELPHPESEPIDVIRVVRAKEFGDINISTLLSLVVLVGLIAALGL
jgi:hypothetical protein